MPPPVGTLERWAFDYVTSVSLEHKLSPPPPPTQARASTAPPATSVRAAGPGRPPELRVVGKVKLARGARALGEPRRRAQLFHTFLHHELQAAELMAHVLCVFPDTPRAFKLGLLRVFFDEIRHLELYRGHLAALGYPVGAFPVRDWFWERLGGVTTPLAFVSAMGVGFEGGNLDHCARFASELAAAGDLDGAAIVRRVGEEEVMHVRFAMVWFARFSGAPLRRLDQLRAALPPPLTPSVMRGVTMDHAARLRAGYTVELLDELEAFSHANPTRLPSPGRT